MADSIPSDSLLRQFRLDEVQVIARQRKEVMPPQVLSGQRLVALSINSVADAVRYFSGVQIKDYGGVGGMKTVDVRSMGSNHLGVFYDGIEIGNAQNGTVDLGKFSMDNLEEVALYNGQKSDIFQPAKDYGSAGTLYLKTRRPKFTPGKRYNLEVRMKAGSFGLANPSILYEQKITDAIHLSANAEYTFATGRYHFRYRKVLPDGTVAWDTTAVRENGDVQACRAEAGIFGYLPDGKWHVKGYFYGSARGIPGAIVNNVWKNSQRQWDRNAFVQGNWTQQLFRRWDVQVNAKYSNDWMRYLNPDTTLMYVDNTYLQQEIYTSMANRIQIFPFWDVAVSADYLANWLSSNMANFAYPFRQTALVAAATAISYKWLKVQASLLETYVHDISRSETWQMVDGNWTKISETQKKDWNALTPAVYVNIKPYLPEEFYARAFYKKVFRMPTFNDLYYTEIGNISLEPEWTTQYDVGAEWTKKWTMDNVQWTIGAKLDGYFNQVKNKIVAVPKGNSQYRWMMMNLGYVEIWGTEAALDLGFVFPQDVRLNLHASYTFQRALDKTDPTDNAPYGGTYNGQIAYIPVHSGSATADLTWKGLAVSYSFVYVGERYTSSANIPANYVQPWYTHDMAASYKWQFKGWALQAGIEVNNLLNQQYEVVPNYPMPGINGKGIVKVMF